MSLLFKHLRVHQVFSANTDVGKTILTTGLVRASAAQKNRVFYLKPVSTGPMQDADDQYVSIRSFLSFLIRSYCERSDPVVCVGM
jgi:bifunctional dethiobiotin synthetase / adenosylmethionine---8-amino-7-oxononanoate aminotransferase